MKMHYDDDCITIIISVLDNYFISGRISKACMRINYAAHYNAYVTHIKALAESATMHRMEFEINGVTKMERQLAGEVVVLKEKVVELKDELEKEKVSKRNKWVKMKEKETEGIIGEERRE